MDDYNKPIFTKMNVLLLLVLCACQSMTAPIVENTSPAIIPTSMTKEEALVQEMQHNNAQSATSFDECLTILETEPWCNIVTSATRITKLEWEKLFPKAEFFLVKYDLYGEDESPKEQHSTLVIEQDGQRYAAHSFDAFLKVNVITVINDTNRELIARALALITLEDRLGEEITFSDLQAGDWPAPFDFRYNYSFTAWTKIQGLSIVYFFLFDQNHLRMIKGHVNALNTGKYIDVPFNTLPPPSQEDLEFNYWGSE